MALSARHSHFKSDLSRPTRVAGLQCPTMGIWSDIKNTLLSFWRWKKKNMFSAFQNFSFLTLWCESTMRNRRFCKKLEKHLSICKGVWDLGFLVTLPIAIPVTQKDSNNQHSPWKNKNISCKNFSYIAVSVTSLIKDALKSELKDNHTCNQAIQYFYLRIKWKELGGTSCLLSYVKEKHFTFWELCMCWRTRFKIFLTIWPVFTPVSLYN